MVDFEKTSLSVGKQMIGTNRLLPSHESNNFLLGFGQNLSTYFRHAFRLR